MTFEEMFGLRDNPFCPNKQYEDVSPFLMSKLGSLPLQIHKAPKLKQLFSENAGSFNQTLTHFRSYLKGYEYDPPGIGTQSFVFLIRGPQGTGKTTLALWMCHWLSTCLPRAPAKWHVVDDWINREFASGEAQVAALPTLRDHILQESSENDYSCVVVDNLLSGAEQEVLNLYGTLFEKRVVITFLITSDQVLLKKKWDNVRFSPDAIYDTGELGPDNAISFIKDRVKVFRVDPQNTAADPLYPFKETDVRQSLESGAASTRRIVTLRQLNITLCNALTQAKVRGEPHRPISLVEAYQQMVA